MTQQTRGEAQNMTVVNLTPSASNGRSGRDSGDGDMQWHYDFYCGLAAEQGVLKQFKKNYADRSIGFRGYVVEMGDALQEAVRYGKYDSASSVTGSGSILHPIVTGLIMGVGIWNFAMLFSDPRDPLCFIGRLLNDSARFGVHWWTHVIVVAASIVIVKSRLER